jgi:hypothetical protein
MVAGKDEWRYGVMGDGYQLSAIGYHQEEADSI